MQSTIYFRSRVRKNVVLRKEGHLFVEAATGKPDRATIQDPYRRHEKNVLLHAYCITAKRH